MKRSCPIKMPVTHKESGEQESAESIQIECMSDTCERRGGGGKGAVLDGKGHRLWCSLDQLPKGLHCKDI